MYGRADGVFIFRTGTLEREGCDRLGNWGSERENNFTWERYGVREITS